MASKLIVDFIGMCVFIQPPPAAGGDTQYVDKVGLLRERRHVHMITYRQQVLQDPPESTSSCRELPDLAVVRGLVPGRYSFYELKDAASAMIHECDPQNPRLPDLEYVGQVTLKSAQHVDNAMAVLLTLPKGSQSGGSLYPRAPIDPNAENDWIFPGLKNPVHLTDRTRLEVDLGDAGLGVLTLLRTGQDPNKAIKIYPEADGVFRIVIAAIDQDLGTREEKPTNGYVLEEFQLFYALTDEFGPSPYYQKVNPADPDSPICPQVRVKPRPKTTNAKS